MMARLVTIGVLLISTTLSAAAQTVWLEPDQFYVQPGDPVKIEVRVGADFVGQVWTPEPGKIGRMEHYAPTGRKDILESWTGDTSGRRVTLDGEGLHVIVMDLEPLLVERDGKSFTAYLEEEGLDDALWQRKRDGKMEAGASELSSNHMKVMLQSGSSTGEGHAKRFSLPLEIVPDRNPATLKRGDRIGFLILLEGKPLFGAKAKVWNRYNHRIAVQNIYTQQNGRIETHVSNPGLWMVSVTGMVPAKNQPADYRTYRTTLVFGVRQD